MLGEGFWRSCDNRRMDDMILSHESWCRAGRICPIHRIIKINLPEVPAKEFQIHIPECRVFNVFGYRQQQTGKDFVIEGIREKLGIQLEDVLYLQHLYGTRVRWAASSFHVYWRNRNTCLINSEEYKRLLGSVPVCAWCKKEVETNMIKLEVPKRLSLPYGERTVCCSNLCEEWFKITYYKGYKQRIRRKRINKILERIDDTRNVISEKRRRLYMLKFGIKSEFPEHPLASIIKERDTITKRTILALEEMNLKAQHKLMMSRLKRIIKKRQAL